MRKRKADRIISGISKVLRDNKTNFRSSAEVMAFMLVANLMADGGHNKKEWLAWIGALWDAGEKITKEDHPPNVISFKKR